MQYHALCSGVSFSHDCYLFLRLDIEGSTCIECGTEAPAAAAPTAATKANRKAKRSSSGDDLSVYDAVGGKAGGGKAGKVAAYMDLVHATVACDSLENLARVIEAITYTPDDRLVKVVRYLSCTMESPVPIMDSSQAAAMDSAIAAKEHVLVGCSFRGRIDDAAREHHRIPRLLWLEVRFTCDPPARLTEGWVG
jgi:hypothetical protein